MNSDTERFLETLMEWTPEGYQTGIWYISEDDRTGQWFSEPQAAVEYVESLDAETHDIYIHVGIAPPDFSKPRAASDDLAGRHALVADLDLPESRTERLLQKLGLPPTMLINSGGGYHAWWMFDEPVIYDGDAAMYDRQEIEALSHDWILTLRAFATDLGITEKLDGVHDLARILRVPGTNNLKKAQPRPVEIIDGDGPRYSYRELADALLPEDRLQQFSSAEVAEVGQLVLRDDAQPPQDKHEVLRMNSDEYAAVWDHTKDIEDDSQSGYDLALANYAAQAGWTEQEIANTIIANRRAHGEDLKLRQDYFARTIGKAMAASKKERILNGEAPKTPEDRQEVIDCLADELDIPLQGIAYVDGQDPVMRFDFGDAGRMQMPAGSVVSKGSWEREVFAATRQPPKVPTGKGSVETWRRMCKAFGQIAEHIELGEDGTMERETVAIIEDYRQKWPAEEIADGEPVTDDESPFYRHGRYWVRIDQVRRHARNFLDLRVKRNALMQRLRVLGAESRTVSVRFQNGESTTRSFWGVPVEALRGDDEQ